jgi:amidohydrolase
VIADDLAGLRAFRRELHRHPETGFEVSATAARVTERLRRAGLEVTAGVGGTGVVGTLRRGSAVRSIGLRADLDALPISEDSELAHASEVDGAHHGCGHDGHTAMLVGAVEALAGMDDLDGTVHVVFQPSEEDGRGAQAMIDDGLFERFPMDAVFGLHNLPGLEVGHLATRVGTFTAFEEVFSIEIAGSGGHASAPHLTVDPILVGAEVVLALQSIVSRTLAPGEHGVVSVTEFVTDGARNIIPSHVTVRGDVRGYHDDVGTTIRRRMEQIAYGVASAHGARARLDYAREFAPVVNTHVETAQAPIAARRVEGMRVDDAAQPVGFSEDFAQYLRHRPGCFVLLGNGSDGAHGRSLHHPRYEFNDDALPFGIDYWCAVVRERLGRSAPH